MIGVVFMGSTIVTPLYTIYAATFGFGNVMLTLIYATYVIGNLAALLIFGRVSDQIGRRKAALPAIGIIALAALGFLFAQSTPWLFAGRALSGFAIGIAAGSGTAWLAELEDKDGAGSAAFISTSANLLGLAMGPILAGILAQYAPMPLRLSYLVYLALVVMTAILVFHAAEPDVRRSGKISFAPRIGVPSAARARFVAPAITAFCTFAFIGFYAALVPSLIAGRLHQANHAVAGAIVCELFVVAALVNRATRHMPSRTAMLAGLAMQLPALALLVAADRMASMPLLIAASAIGGSVAALGYRGSLSVVNEIAPADAKAEIVSSYMIVCFIGNSLPVIGVALLSRALSDAVAALTIFAIVVALFAVSAILYAVLADTSRRQ
ncbi:MAG: MFS transporter [Pseudomonadota bacterium]